MRYTEPIDRPIHADQGRGPHVANDAVVFNRLVTRHHLTKPPIRRLWDIRPGLPVPPGDNATAGSKSTGLIAGINKSDRLEIIIRNRY